ncbi:MAG TPA: hypothetical protein VFW75_16145 [Acetobacteraceae bacterium]|nr:hypothetical protein [Acetobacteraceae bacterium]
MNRPRCCAVRLRGMAVLFGIASLLGACKDLATIAAVASGTTTGAATGNPAIGFAVGVGVSAAGNFLVRYVGRVRAGAEQDVIASTAGDLPVGSSAPWVIHHTIPIGNEHGSLQVIDVISTSIAVCKEVVFSVIDGNGPTAPRRWYQVDVCRDPAGWKWATAEPAVARWGFLQ